jgi:hypothetical protein
MAALSWGQFGSGIQGTVLDRSGGVVPGARVTVKNLDTGVVRETLSSEEGVYRVLSLSPARYSVSAAKPGLLTAQQDSVVLAADEIRKIDFTLEVGNVTETVSVTAQPTALETEEGRISGRIETVNLEKLPIPDRNVYNLLSLQPGVTGRSLGSDILGGRSTVQVYANGQAYQTNSYSLDNMTTNSPSVPGGTEITPNLEALEEVRIVANNFSADEGRSPGAHVSVISKAGTNSLHGALWDYFQNNTLTARNFFDAVSVPAYRRNQFGAAVGGPIIRNRTFFFATYEGTRASGGTTTAATVETPQLVSYVNKFYPNSIAAKLFNEFPPLAYPTFAFRDLGTPLPGVANGSSSTPLGFPAIGSVQFVDPYTNVADQYTIRIDHELVPSKDRLYVFYYHAEGTPKAEPIRPQFFRSTTTTGWFGNVNHTHIFSPSKLNEFRVGVVRYQGIYTVPQHLEVPEVVITGSTGFQNANNSPGYGTPYYPGGWFPIEKVVKDTFFWTRGRHSFRMGGEIRRLNDNVKHTRNYIPQYTFASILNFAVDQPIQMVRTVDPRTGQPTFTQNAMRSWEGALFLQDDWKARRDLTFNMGLRYEYYGAYTDVTNRLQNFVPGPGATVYQQIASGSAQVVANSYQNNDHFPTIGPRFGFAWDIGSKGQNVIRGGYGLAFDRLSTIPVETTRGNPPIAGTVTLGTFFGTPFTYSLGDPSKPGLGYPIDPALAAGLDPRNGIVGLRISLSAVNPNFRQPYIHNWFLSVQRSLPGRMVLEASYLGSSGHNLINTPDVNRFNGDLLNGGVFHGLNPSFSQINQVNTTANSIYNGGTLTVRRQFSRGLHFQVAYTFGKAITEGELNYMDANNRNLDRGPASYDVPQRVAMSGLWDLPFLRTCTSWGCKVAGGWQLSGYAVFEKGLPLNIITTAAYPKGDFNADGTTGLDRPNAPSSNIPRSGFNKQQFLNGIFSVSDFPLPAAGTDGTLGRDVFRGPGFARVDLSMTKGMKFTERLSAQLRIDAFNSFNRVNLNAPSVDLNSNTFGKSTGAQVSRNLQVSLTARF